MAHRYKEVETPQRYLIPVDAVCDRCGQSAGITGMGRDRVAWGEISAVMQGDGAYVADLCRACTAELVAWINNGDGNGMRDGSERPQIVA